MTSQTEKKRSRTLRLFLYFSSVLLYPQEALMGIPGQWELLRGFAHELHNSIQVPVLMVKQGCRVLLQRCRGEPSLHAIPSFFGNHSCLLCCTFQAPPALVSLWQGPFPFPGFIILFLCPHLLRVRGCKQIQDLDLNLSTATEPQLLFFGVAAPRSSVTDCFPRGRRWRG